MTDLNDTEAARIALEQVWRQLAPVVDEARHKQLEATKNPSHWTDPDVDAQLKWLSVFGQELANIQAVYEAALEGARLSPEEIYSARKVGEKLIEVIPSDQGSSVRIT